MARTKSVLLRLTEEEHARLKELAGREPVNAYLRRVAGLEGIASEPRPERAKGSVLRAGAPSWFCPTCNTIQRIPRCARDPSHKVTPT